MSSIGNLDNKVLTAVGLGDETSTAVTPAAIPEQEVHYQTGFDKFIAGKGGDAILTTLEILALPVKLFGSLAGCATPEEQPCTASNSDREDGKWPTTIVTGYDVEPTKPNECQELQDAVNIAVDDGAEVILGWEEDADGKRRLTTNGTVITNKTNMTIKPADGVNRGDVSLMSIGIEDDGTWATPITIGEGATGIHLEHFRIGDFAENESCLTVQEGLDSVSDLSSSEDENYNAILTGMEFMNCGENAIVVDDSRVKIPEPECTNCSVEEWAEAIYDDGTLILDQPGRSISVTNGGILHGWGIGIGSSWDVPATDHAIYVNDSEIQLSGYGISHVTTDATLSTNSTEGHLIMLDHSPYALLAGGIVHDNTISGGAIIACMTGDSRGYGEAMGENFNTSEVGSLLMVNNTSTDTIVQSGTYDLGGMALHNIEACYNNNSSSTPGEVDPMGALLTVDRSEESAGQVTAENFNICYNTADFLIETTDGSSVADPEFSEFDASNINSYQNETSDPDGEAYLDPSEVEPLYTGNGQYIEDPNSGAFEAGAFRPDPASDLVLEGDFNTRLVDCSSESGSLSTISAYGGQFGCEEMDMAEGVVTAIDRRVTEVLSGGE